MDGGAWWATVHGVTKSRTRLSDNTFKTRIQVPALPFAWGVAVHSPFSFLLSALSRLLTLAKESTPCLWKLMNHSYARKGLSANMVTFQAPIRVKPQQSLCVSFQQHVSVSTSLAAVGP